MATENIKNTAVKTETVQTTKETDGGVAASLGLNTQLFVFQLINFVIVALILWFLILKPLVKKMEERKVLIDESLDKAKEVETRLQMSEKVYQEKIDEAKVEANKIMEQTHITAEEMGKEMKENAKQEIELLVKQAKNKIESEKNAMIEGVKNNAVDLVMFAVEKIVKEKFDGKANEKYVKGIINEVKENYEKGES